MRESEQRMIPTPTIQLLPRLGLLPLFTTREPSTPSLSFRINFNYKLTMPNLLSEFWRRDEKTFAFVEVSLNPPDVQPQLAASLRCQTMGRSSREASYSTNRRIMSRRVCRTRTGCGWRRRAEVRFHGHSVAPLNSGQPVGIVHHAPSTPRIGVLRLAAPWRRAGSCGPELIVTSRLT